MGQRLANELLEASEGRGAAMKKREDASPGMAEANKASRTIGFNHAVSKTAERNGIRVIATASTFRFRCPDAFN